VIQRVAELAKWQPPTSKSKTRARTSAEVATGRGLAFLQYENENTYVATIADVSVNRRTGAIRVTRAYVAHDCGLIINPDGLRNQIEGGTIQTISRTLKEQVQWDRHGVTTVDWASYPILTFAEVPETIVIALIDQPDQPSLGAGEAAACAVPAAISNAVFDAIGVRLRHLPFTPERVKQALLTRVSAND
jgi:nicotinate dehydrogenase subunit B